MDSPKEQEDLAKLNTYAFIKHNPTFKCKLRKKRITLQQYREELVKRWFDMDKTDIMIFKKYLMGATFAPNGYEETLSIDIQMSLWTCQVRKKNKISSW